eukprot:993631-Karenia_brevis.AAC.1
MQPLHLARRVGVGSAVRRTRSSSMQPSQLGRRAGNLTDRCWQRQLWHGWAMASDSAALDQLQYGHLGSH